MNWTRMLLPLVLCCGVLVSAPGLGDSIAPSSINETLGVGESTIISKTITITTQPPTTALVDVFFLADTTGSMYGEIAAVKAGAGSIMASTSTLGNVAYGVGEYKDFDGDPFAYQQNVDITTNTAMVQSAIDTWGASGGGDWEEAQLFAMNEVATGSTWRPGSTRILVWFGDAPGHDPSGGITEAAVITSLNAENIVVEALDVYYLDELGQATAITNATSGHLYSGVDSGAIVTQITDAIAAVFDDYGMVSLGLSGAPAGVSVTASPASHVGTFDRSVENEFDFDVTFTGVTPGVYDFEIQALVDGGIVATETDHIVVEDIIPEPATIVIWSLLGVCFAGAYRLRRRNGWSKSTTRAIHDMIDRG